MNNSHNSLSAALICLMVMAGVAYAQKEFTLLEPDVVVANKELANQLRALTWRKAEDTWVPTNAQVLEGLERLRTEGGAAEILASAIGGVDMGPSLRLVSDSRYQVFGLVFDNRKQILYDASPKNAALEEPGSDRWLKEIISVSVLHGGLVYWWALYDVQSGHFVLSNRKP